MHTLVAEAGQRRPQDYPQAVDKCGTADGDPEMANAKRAGDKQVTPHPPRVEKLVDKRGLCALLLDPVRQFGDLVVDRAALGHQLPDLLLRVHHGRMVAAAELLTDLRQRQIGQFAAQVHRDLPGRDQDTAAGSALEVLDRQAEVGGRLRHDRGVGDLVGVLIVVFLSMLTNSIPRISQKSSQYSAVMS